MRFTAAFLSLLGASAFLIACPSAPTPPVAGSTEVTGTVGGAALKSLSAVSQIVPHYPPNNAPAVNALRIRFSDKENTCDETHEASSMLMTVMLVVDTPIAAGTFPIVTGEPADHQATVTFQNLDATCNDSVHQTATGGTITIKGATFTAGGHVNGTVDATFAGGTLSGTFYSEGCAPFAATPPGPDAGTDFIACVP